MAAALAPTSLIKIVFVNDLIAYLRCTRNQVRRLRRLDPTFPKPFRIGTGRNGTLAWYQGEIDQWLAERPRVVLPDKPWAHPKAASVETSSAI